MKLSQLEYICEVNKCGNMTAAANNLFVTQPTLSQQIINLEEELGVRLFIRMPRKVILTPAGEEFLKYARRILSDIDNLKTAMGEYSILKKGRIRIGMLSTFGCLNIIDRVSIFKKENPDIDILLSIANSNKLLETLQSRELDAAFLIIHNPALEEHPGIWLQKVIEDDMLVIMPKGSKLAEKSLISYKDLSEENIIIPHDTSGLRKPIMAGFTACGTEPRIVCETSHPELVMQMVSSGMAAAFSSERVVANFSKQYVFEARPMETVLKRSVYYAVLEDSMNIQAIKRFSDFIVHVYLS